VLREVVQYLDYQEQTFRHRLELSERYFREALHASGQERDSGNGFGSQRSHAA
jgi:hypothetical protein